MHLIDKHLEHLLFILEDENVRVSLLLNLLLEVEGQRLLIEFTEQCETLELRVFSRAVLIDLVLNDA